MNPRREPRLDPSRMEDGKGAWLMVGLSNPGIEYAQTRHDYGYVVTGRSVESIGGRYRNQSLGRRGTMAKVADIHLEYSIDAPQVIVAHTSTHMNASEPMVGQLLKFYQIDTAHLVVVHDNIDLNSRYTKLKVEGSNEGYNRLKSIQQTLGTRDFARLRIGVGRPPSRELDGDAVDWVLEWFSKSEKANLEEFFNRAIQCINDVVESDLAKAQTRLHLGNP